MKILNSIKGITFVCLSLWTVLLITQIFFVNPLNGGVGSVCLPLDIMLNIITLILAIIFYRNILSEDKYAFIWFLVVIVFMTLNNASYYLTIYLSHNLVKDLPVLHFFLNNMTFNIWIISAIVFLSWILIKNVLSSRLFFKILSFFILANFIVVALFAVSLDYVFGALYWQNILLILSFTVELILFDLTIISLIYSNSRAVSLILAGLIVLISSDSLYTYCYISKEPFLIGYSDILWLLGHILMFLGALALRMCNRHSIKDWFRSSTSIKSKLVFWAFSISALSFIIFCVTEYIFSIVSNTAFVGLPLFLMIYSIIIVVFSLFMGSAFEAPFKRLEHNIESLIINDDKNVTSEDFTIDEFVFINKHIMKSLKFREEREKLEKQMGEAAAQVAHDIASPMNTMSVVIYNLKNGKAGSKDISLLEHSMQSVKSITNNLLNRYRLKNTDTIVDGGALGYDDGNVPRYIVLSTLITEVIENKLLEWGVLSCHISSDLDAGVGWINIAPLHMSRVLSNLLNNAYESLTEDRRDIDISLKYIDHSFILSVKDSGSGIAPDKIQEVLEGKSLKHSGKGMGLSNAVSYVNSLGGKLTLNSVVGVGTEVIISCPIVVTPKWYPSSIEYNKNTLFILLDDDSSILMLWQKCIMTLGVQSKYFLNVSEFINWYTNRSSNLTDFILFTDYDLHDKEYTGLDIIKHFEIECAYLVTNHAQECWLQKIAEEGNLNLIPKGLINKVKFLPS